MGHRWVIDALRIFSSCCVVTASDVYDKFTIVLTPLIKTQSRDFDPDC